MYADTVTITFSAKSGPRSRFERSYIYNRARGCTGFTVWFGPSGETAADPYLDAACLWDIAVVEDEEREECERAYILKAILVDGHSLPRAVR